MKKSFANNHIFPRMMSASRHTKFKKLHLHFYVQILVFVNTPICDNVINKNCHLFIVFSLNICTVLLKLFHTTNWFITGLVICIISLFSCLSLTLILTSLKFVFVHLSFCQTWVLWKAYFSGKFPSTFSFTETHIISTSSKYGLLFFRFT